MPTRAKYGFNWDSKITDLKIEFWMIRKGQQWLKEQGRDLFFHYKEAQSLLWPEDDHHRWSDLALRRTLEHEIVIFMGCGACVGGETVIDDPITGKKRSIASLVKSQTAPVVMTLNGPEQAGIPFLKGRDLLYEIVLENGSRFTCTGHHRVLTESLFCRVSNLRPGSKLFSIVQDHRNSTSDSAPLARAQDACRCSETLQDFQDGCHPSFHFGDEQLPRVSETSPTSAQPQVGVQKHTDHMRWGGDGRDSTQKHSQPCVCGDHPSNSDFSPQGFRAGSLSSLLFDEETISHGGPEFQQRGRLPSENIRPFPFSSQVPDSSRTEKLNSLSSWGYRVVVSRIESIRMIGRKPFYDITVPKAHHYFAEGAVHHNSNKSYSMARFALCDWFAFPSETLWLVSSTEYRGADLRIWGDIQLLFNRALRRHPYLPGVPMASMHAISREDIGKEDDDYFKAARSMKRGLIVVPNKKGNLNVGLSPFVGVRVPRLRHAGDEISMMTSGFLDAYSNWYGNSDFKGMMCGNPLDITDQLCVAAEPETGWDDFADTGKTQEWTSKFFHAHVIAFDGRDSPNFDFPNAETHPKYGYMIGPKKLKAVKDTYGEDSWQWFSQCVGKPNKGLLLWRVITSSMCEKNNAHEPAIWATGEGMVKIYACDPAYGGGDRCVGGYVEFGKSKDGVQTLRVFPPEIIPVNFRLKAELGEPEEQIARHIKRRLTELDIPASNCFYDSFGRGTLGFYFAKEFGASTPVPIDSGAQPSTRPVRFDLFTEDSDGKKRLKRCDEHYSKFVTEMWFSVAETIQSGQMRDLPKDVMWEGCARIYKVVKGNRLEVEPKDDMKERINKSPDLFDWLALSCEGARQRGFKIQRIGTGVDEIKKKPNALEKDSREFRKIQSGKQLQTA